MTKLQIVEADKQMMLQGQTAFQHWLNANAVLGAMFSALIFAMAWGGLVSSGKDQASVGSAAAEVELSAAVRHHELNEIKSIHELTIQMSPDQLPKQYFQDPF